LLFQVVLQEFRAALRPWPFSGMIIRSSGFPMIAKRLRKDEKNKQLPQAFFLTGEVIGMAHLLPHLQVVHLRHG
jgi:hypothetical protein